MVPVSIFFFLFFSPFGFSHAGGMALGIAVSAGLSSTLVGIEIYILDGLP